jgi:hypothetical protein
VDDLWWIGPANCFILSLLKSVNSAFFQQQKSDTLLSKFFGTFLSLSICNQFRSGRRRLEIIQSKTIKVIDKTSSKSRRLSHLTASTSHLIPPHGGELINLIAQPEKVAEAKAHSKEWPSWDLTGRQLCDLELLISGGFSPLRGFMSRADYEGVCHNMRLASGVLWPMPVTLDVTEEFAKKLTPGTSKVALRDPEGVMIAVLDVEDIWQPDRKGFSPAPVPRILAPTMPSTRRIPGTSAERSKGRRILRTMIFATCA